MIGGQATTARPPTPMEAPGSEDSRALKVSSHPHSAVTIEPAHSDTPETTNRVTGPRTSKRVRIIASNSSSERSPFGGYEVHIPSGSPIPTSTVYIAHSNGNLFGLQPRGNQPSKAWKGRIVAEIGGSESRFPVPSMPGRGPPFHPRPHRALAPARGWCKKLCSPRNVLRATAGFGAASPGVWCGYDMHAGAGYFFEPGSGRTL